MKKKNAFTLLEIMIVIFLIGLIGSIIGYNMKGSLDEGKAFKSRQAALQLCDLLELEIAKGADPKYVVDHAEDFLKATGVVKSPKDLLKDAWGNPFEITYPHNNIRVFSATLKRFDEKKQALRKHEVNHIESFEEENEE